MPSYPNTPSPRQYGLSGGLMIVNENGNPMSGGVDQCGTLIPSSHPELYISKSSQHGNQLHSHATSQPRPILRPSSSYNATTPNQPHSPASWARRFTSSMQISMRPTINSVVATDSSRPGATNAISSVPSAQGRHAFTTGQTVSDETHEAGALPSTGTNARSAASTNEQGAVRSPEHASSTSTSAPNEATRATVTTTSSVVPPSEQSSSFPMTEQVQSYPPLHTHTHPYNDDLSFSTSNNSYAGTENATGDSSFDSSCSYPSATSWSLDPHAQAQYYGWGMSSPPKLQEPILAPGELPAPRPPMSYAALIGEALLLAPPPHQLYVSEISDSIKKRYAYYRQNPTKIYNGVRHQTSMCKAFVKLPRPFGDQSGGARKWAIRAGCESWFSNGSYNPPGYHAPTKKPSASGKTKSTSSSRSKQLAIGTSSPHRDSPFLSPNAGPSVGPAYDGTSRPYYPYPQPTYSAPPPPPPPAYLPPGYHYVPVNPTQTHQSAQPMYVPVWGHYAAPPPPGQMVGVQGMGVQGGWRYEDKESPESYEEHARPMSPHSVSLSVHGSEH
ncbi:hypothetical protein M231_06921 [Tremella mesenterica]|uniref:Fork-head domain-containing protein n=1 Tax=Tremella mesenterica TaxID=5217 RepID=A0A4Q1BCN6_TREME|nr:hypothetical protein M231_06921 [Tremella mesenterica]